MVRLYVVLIVVTINKTKDKYFNKNYVHQGTVMYQPSFTFRIWDVSLPQENTGYEFMLTYA